MFTTVIIAEAIVAVSMMVCSTVGLYICKSDDKTRENMGVRI